MIMDIITEFKPPLRHPRTENKPTLIPFYETTKKEKSPNIRRDVPCKPGKKKIIEDRCKML